MSETQILLSANEAQISNVPVDYLEKRTGCSSDILVSKSNEILKEACFTLGQIQAIPFGSALKEENADMQVFSTIAHRFKNKFEEPSSDNDQALKKACFDDWVKWEEDHLQQEDFFGNMKALTNYQRGRLYEAQKLIGKWCGSYKVYLKQVNIKIPPGESFIAMRGHVSVYQKLRKKQHWTVTWNCIDDASTLIYHNVSLKRCAKFWFSKDSCYLKNLYNRFRGKPDKGFLIFKQQLLDHVFTIVDGSRGSSVYKNTEKRRFINVEATFSVILQRLLAEYIRTSVKKQGNDLELGQLKHKRLIRKDRYATIDFSNASDSVHYDATKFMLRNAPKFLEKVLEWRSYSTKLGTAWHVPQKISSMGNGYTFELMTLQLLAIARSLTLDSFVYGDDVIILNDHSTDFIALTHCLGFRVNHTKTFTHSKLRESCGAFHLDGYGSITCFDIKWLETPSDLIVTCNKFYRILADLKVLGSKTEELQKIIAETHTKLLSLVPTLLKGYPHFDHSVLNTHVWSDVNIERSHRKNTFSSKYFRKHGDLVMKTLSALQMQKGFVFVVTPKFKEKCATNQLNLKKFKTSSASFAAASYAGRRTKDVIQWEGHWEYQVHISCTDGNLFSLASLTTQ